MNDLFRFPHTPHLFWLGNGKPRSDKIMSEADVNAFLNSEILLEEKVDGANIGISVGPGGEIHVQNRGQYLQRPFSGQFAGLNAWLDSRQDAIIDKLGEGHIMFGEWCEARHTVDYDRLSDWFLAFDLYEIATGRFYSSRRRNRLAKRARNFDCPFHRRRTLHHSRVDCSYIDRTESVSERPS